MIIYIPYKPGVRRNEDGILEDEENFDEAVKSVNTALVPTRVSLTFRILESIVSVMRWDIKICPEDHQMASQGLLSDDKR